MVLPNSFEKRLSDYLDIVLRLGVNLQPDQTLVVTTGPAAVIEEFAPLARALSLKAYNLGARAVYVEWADAELARTRMRLAPTESLTSVPLWRARWLEELAEQGAAFVRLSAPDPSLYDGVDPERVSSAAKAEAQAGVSLARSAATLHHPWTVASYASRVWARRVYPEKEEPDALAALWNYIFNAVRINEPDPMGAWRRHLALLNQHAAALTTASFRRLHYHAPGTDLRLELPERQVWNGGGNAVSAQGVAFVPNLPTEEVFCLPVRTGVEGVVTSTAPLNYNGTLIEGLRLRFEAGRIVEYEATAGQEALRTLIETDEGSHYLGEVALVPADTPVNIGRPVLNTLFDENAACHLAIGRAYPICIEGGAEMSPEELAARGVNQSLAHVDFMIGSDQLNIDGETASGELIPVFRAGMWAL